MTTLKARIELANQNGAYVEVTQEDPPGVRPYVDLLAFDNEHDTTCVSLDDAARFALIEALGGTT